MRKILVLSLALMLTFCMFLSGCNAGRIPGKIPTSKVLQRYDGEIEQNVEIKVLENDMAISSGYFKELLAAFNEEYKQYGIKAIDAKMDEYADLETDGPYGYGPDVLYQANDMLMKYVAGKHIMPIPIERLDCYEDVSEAAWQPYVVEVGGTMYTCGVPVNVQAPLLYYRKDLLPVDWKTAWDKNSNDIPDMVETWNDMYKYSKHVKETQRGKFGYMKSLFDVYFSAGYLFSYGAYIFGDNNTNPKDIGFSKGQSEKGAWVLRQLATVMDEGCIDDSITKTSYTKIADGTFFATMTTPDVYKTFIKELVREYKSSGMSAEDAEDAARENLVMCGLPKLPLSGDLNDYSGEFIDCKMMGGVNGYAISSYTKVPKASLAFIDFATSYENMRRRNELLGVAPARADAAEDIGMLALDLLNSLNKGNINIMPSINAVSQIWSPAENLFRSIASDAFKKPSEILYTSPESLKEGLRKVDKDIYNAIFVLS